MSVEIYYFSGTGNSLHVARELQKRMPGTRLIPIAGLLSRESVRTGSEAVGFVFPIYNHTIPVFIKEFAGRLDLESARYIFAVATAHKTQCRAFTELEKVLKKKGRQLDSSFVFKMVHNMPFYSKYPDFIAEDNVESIEAALPGALDEASRIINSREKHIIKSDEFTRAIPAPLRPFMPVLIPVDKFIVKSMTVFYADSKCTGCGTCEKVCLSYKIRMAGKAPEWLGEVECFQCQACINYCPAHAIQQKDWLFMKSHSAGNGRHHDPRIKAEDIASQKAAGSHPEC